MLVSGRLRVSAALLAACSLAACTLPPFNVKAPTPSDVAYQGAQKTALPNLTVKDLRAEGQKTFLSGVLPINVTYNGGAIDPPQFLATQLQAELQARGVAGTVAVGSDGSPRLDLLNFQMVDYRLNAYGPFVTYTYLSTDLSYGPMTKRVAVWVKRGKVPVWSFDEVIDPTLNEPMSIAVKELAAKISADVGGYKADDSTVDAMIAKLGDGSGASYLDVYALGFTNNPKAVGELVRLTDEHQPDDYVRMAAIAGLGTLGATSQFDLLKSIHENPARAWEDRVMSLKAIGDLGTPAAKAYLKAQAQQIGNPAANDQVAIAMSKVIALYLL